MTVAALWAAYVLALPFQRVWVLPGLDYKLQPPEVIFLALAAVTVIAWTRRSTRWRFDVIDLAACAWVGANVLALVWSNGPIRRAGVIEALTAAYVAGIYAVARITATPQLLDRFGAWFAYSAAIAAGLGIFGWIAANAGVATELATAVITPVPYLGHAPRAQAFTAGPQMLASLLLLAVPLFVAHRMPRGWRGRDRALLLLLVIGLAATVSKTALCLAAGLTVMWASAPRQPPPRHVHGRAWIALGAWVIVAGLFTAASHVMVIRAAEAPAMRDAQLIAGEPVAAFRWRGEPWVAVPTTYVFNKQVSLLAAWRRWPAGLGPAGQPPFALDLQDSGQVPRTVWLTPHSTYLGAMAELGVAGLLALALLLAAGGVTVRRLLASESGSRWEAAAYAGAGAAFLIEAISTDLLNCRHYWLLLGVMAARRQASLI
jgi:hypothetical protein